MLQVNKVNQAPQEEGGHRGFQGSMAAGGHQGHVDVMVRQVSRVNEDPPASKVPPEVLEPMGCLV